ncbi:hypothetical protein DPEC_G00143720 [Dallia pectoralis]|uniref:Uncharacterized protein n=1 Tax=Dallia pectoralis TaxID=75939 RepID=A0ACC2GND5_DALPE|nr:hypothetical protein DPEC_G00143720 [Dallia pectoralis]
MDKDSWLYRLKYGKLENKSEDEDLGQGTSGVVTVNRAHREAVGGGHDAEGAGEPEDSHLTQQDYLQLMKILGIRLPEGVLTPDVIEKANMENTIQDAQAILRDLEHFRIRFKVIPRLSCREVKDFLAMKDDVLAITKILFFYQKN